MKKFISLLLAAIMLLSLGAAAYAEDADPNGGTTPGGGTTPSGGIELGEFKGVAVFTNAPNPRPDLTVSKVVESDSSVTPPDEDFTFQLFVKQDSELLPYGNQIYTLLDANGNEIPVPAGQSSPQTNNNGIFTLKNGQKAKFVYVGQYEYKVTELNIPTNFRCSAPVGGTATGTISADGAYVEFTNVYAPPKNTAELTVQKELSWPGEYTYENPDEVLFTYTLTLDGNPAANEKYSYYAPGSSTADTADHETTASGTFTLPIGGKAVFKELDADKLYLVTESSPEGWHEVDPQEHTGSTSENKTEVFYNTCASFSVQKTLSSGTSDDDFTFRLLKEDAAWKDAEFWLYTTNGRRVHITDETGVSVPVVGRTNSNGEFTLKQNQAAVFVKLAPGTRYTVTEVLSDDYEQISPSKSATENKQVTDNGAVVHKFINKPIDPTGTLLVSKKLVYSGYAPLTDESFTFVLMNKEHEAVANAVYTISGDSKDYKTGTDGVFTLKANQTAKFTGLAYGTYYVKEVLDAENMPGYTFVSATPAADHDCEAGGFLGGDGLSVSFTNNYVAKELTLNIHKYWNDKGTETPLSGAAFALYLDSACTVPFFTEADGSAKLFTSDASGNLTMTPLREGTFYLREEKAPAGFARIPGTVILNVERKMIDGKESFEVKVESNLEKVTAIETKTYIYNGSGTLELRIDDDAARIYALPSTGGIGTGLFTLLGLAIMATMTFLFIKEKKKEN